MIVIKVLLIIISVILILKDIIETTFDNFFLGIILLIIAIGLGGIR